MTDEHGRDATRAASRRIVLRATLYMYGFMAAAVIVAVGGAALLAWLLTRTGLPFMKTWAVLAIVILLPSLLILVVRAVKERSGRKS